MFDVIKLCEVEELKELFIKEYNEYLKLIKNVELYYEKLEINWKKFHLFYQQNKKDPFEYHKEKNKYNKIKKVQNKKKNINIYSDYQSIEKYFKMTQEKEIQNNCYYYKKFDYDKYSFILYTLKKNVTNAVELYININIEKLNKIKNYLLNYINDFCKRQINQIIILIILCEIKLNNLYISQKNHYINNNKKIKHIHLIKNIIHFNQQFIFEVTKNLIPFFTNFNIFSSPDYFNYHFNYFNNCVEIIGE
ncbi:conserved Plasmodium protein, unknown function [Plasmodium sp. gorilla clade G3]|nr:conserved Plasmodium protein, unknown function [Plasmodium sp. gorilla clade G3]